MITPTVSRTIVALLLIGIGLGSSACASETEPKDPDPKSDAADREAAMKRLFDETSTSEDVSTEGYPGPTGPKFCKKCLAACGDRTEFCYCSCCSSCH